MTDIEKILESSDLPPKYVELLRKRPVVYSPAVPADQVEAGHFSAARMQQFLVHYSAQETMTTCSAATAHMIISVIRSAYGLKGCTVDEVLASNKDQSWLSSVATLQCKGVSLKEFKAFLDEATRMLVPDPVKITAHTLRSLGQSELDAVRSLVKRVETDTNFFIAVNFNQAALLTDGFDVGHMSVLGGYDAAHNRALIFDVDIRKLQPYWIPLDILAQGLNTYDSDAQDYRGIITLEVYP